MLDTTDTHTYGVGMRTKTSVTLSEETLAALEATRGEASRSQLIETAIAEFLERRARAERDRSERAILDANAEALNAEMADVLQYQVEG